MSKLQDLIDRLCPNGVEFKKMGEICKNICSGGTPLTSNKSYYNGTIPWMRTQEVDWKDVYDTEIKISEEAVKNSSTKLIPANCVIVAMYGATAAKVCINKIPLTTNQACCNLEIDDHIASYKYVYYWLCNSYEVLKAMGEGSQNNINGQKIKNFPIPIPPLEVQEEIVKILDRFADYAAELQAELQARKEQYEYYRNLLLTFNPSAYGSGTDDEQKDDITRWGGRSYKIQWKTMEEVFEMRNGYTPSKNESSFWEDGTIPWFRMEDIRENGRILSDSIQHITPAAVKGKGLFEANSFILATTATIGEHALIIADSLANQQFTNLKVRKSLSNLLETKFIFYYMFVVDEFCKNNTNVSGFASVDMGKLKRMPFPIPPMELQEKIVAILDRFETLVNDLSKGLPAEIEAVKAQYEYYRNKLLTFKQIAG